MSRPRHRRNTVRLTNRGHAAVVVVALTSLALSWLQVSFAPEAGDVTAIVSARAAQGAAKSHEKSDREQAHQPGRGPTGSPRGPATGPETNPETNPATNPATDPVTSPALGPPAHARGADIGWPQCPRNVGFGGRFGLGQPMPDPQVSFVIVGLTNGRAFTPNPCLAMHLRWVRNHKVFASAYAFAAYPSAAQLRRYRSQGPWDGRQLLGALKNAGHAAARYNIGVMRKHGFLTPHVWLDVEPSSSRPWSPRPRLNSAVVRGWIRGYRDAGYSVGFYSTTNLWRAILGRIRFNLPEWRTAGPVSPQAALRKCGSGSFQGGRAVIAQWWTARRDFDRICPGTARTTLARYFHKW